MCDLIIKKTKIRDRNGVAWIDCSSNYGRLRFSSGERYSKELAQDLASRVKDLALNFLKGKSPSDRVKAVKENLNINERIKLKDLADEFIQRRCNHLKPQTLSKYKWHITNLDKLIRFDMRFFDQAQYDSIYSKIDKAGLDFLNRLIGYAKESDVIHSKIILNKRQKVAQKEASIKPLTLEQAKNILMLAGKKSQESYKAKARQMWQEVRNYLTFAIFTGARVGELMALEISDIDIENEKIYISKSKERKSQRINSTKTSKARYIDMIKIVKESAISQINIREEKPSKSGRLFDISENGLMSCWKELLKECGLESRVLYQTRHSFATIMLTNGEEPLWISAMLGHSSLHTTFTYYVKYIPQKKKRAGFVDFSLCGGGVQ